jgi:hypothetical protein
MPGYADGYFQRRAIDRNAAKHSDEATPTEYANRFNATRDLYEQAQEEEMGSPEVGLRGSKATK